MSTSQAATSTGAPAAAAEAVSFVLNETEAYLITYICLVVFAAVAALAVPLVYRGFRNKDDNSAADPADFWYSARDSQGWVSIALSIFASSAGAWMLFAAPEVGAIGGWWGCIGYSTAIVLAPLAMCWLAPMVRSRLGDGVTVVDWIEQRFGTWMYLYVSVIGVFYMWVYLVAELTSMGNLLRTFSGLDPLVALVPVSLVTMLYTMVAGLPASIFTDRVQGVIMVAFIVIVCIACWSDVEITEDRWKAVANFNDHGFEVLVSLCLAVFGAEIFNMSTWQRVYAAKNERELYKGFMAGSVAVAIATFLFGICGMLGEASTETGLTIKVNAFFELVFQQENKFIKVLTYILATCMVASSVDSLQTGIVSVFSKQIMKRKMHPAKSMIFGQVFVLAVNIPAILMAAKATNDLELNLRILDLFMIADIVMISLPVPIFAGLWPFVTTLGSALGITSGLLVVLAWGWVEYGTFMAGMEMFTLMTFGNIAPPVGEKGLYATRTPMIFFVIPIVTFVVTFTVSWMQRAYEKMASLSQKLDALEKVGHAEESL